jgi:hypothetical protein
MRSRAGLLCALGLLALSGELGAGALAEPLPYVFTSAPVRDDLLRRVPPPPGARRVPLAEHSFGEWLRRLPLLPPDTQVHLHDGRLKERQDVHAAVVDIDVGKRDLQQCADAVMRLRAEYLYAAGRQGQISFHPDPGKPRALTYTGGRDRAAFARYLVRVFAEAGTASLQAELRPVAGRVLPGDVLIQGGYPGHAVLVLDAAEDDAGRRYLLLGQSYMPAQQFHLLKDLGDPGLSPWYDEATLGRDGLKTPEWRPFRLADVRRFPEPR